jgi:hypothetical protein
MSHPFFHRHMLGDALADSIRARLFAHEFLPGDILDTEALAAHYGVGRQPLFSALDQLVRERLLTAAPEGFGVAKFRQCDVEGILRVLEQMRQFSLRLPAFPCAETARTPQDAIAESVYWGMAGFCVERCLAVAARSLYAQLHTCLGPALPIIEAACADAAYREALRQAKASGHDTYIEHFGQDTARAFRLRVLSAFTTQVGRKSSADTQEAPEFVTVE